MEYEIIPSLPSDHKVLSEIAMAAKAYWNYPKEWLELWKPDMTVTAEMLVQYDCWKIQSGDETIGFTLILPGETSGYEIEHCWIRPEHIGKGYGSKLLKTVLAQDKYKNQLFGVLVDPNAVPFYEKFGFKKVRDVPGKPAGRTLPWMEMVNEPEAGS